MHTSSKSLLLVLATFVVAAGVSLTFWAFGNPLAIDRTGTAGDGSEGEVVVTPNPPSDSQAYLDLIDCRIPDNARTLSAKERTGYAFFFAGDCDRDANRHLMATGDIDYTARLKGSETTLLHAAAANTRHPDVIELLLDKDISINARTATTVGSKGATPLGYALQSDNVVATEVLLRAGADPNVSYEQWDSVSAYCKEYTDSEYDYLRDRPACEVLYEWLDE